MKLIEKQLHDLNINIKNICQQYQNKTNELDRFFEETLSGNSSSDNVDEINKTLLDLYDFYREIYPIHTVVDHWQKYLHSMAKHHENIRDLVTSIGERDLEKIEEAIQKLKQE